MQRIKLSIFLFLLILSLLTDATAKEWRGITPLHSTRDDVVRLFGTSPTGGNWDYEFENERVFFDYQYPNKLCGQQWGFWNVPLYTVLGIEIYPKNKITFTDLPLDISKYKKSRTCDPGRHHYYNSEEGINYTVKENIVEGISYRGTDKDKNLLCAETDKTN